MKSKARSILILLLFLSSAGGWSVSADVGCEYLLPNISTTLLDSLEHLRAWHDAGYCGDGIVIGVISSVYPDRQIDELLNGEVPSLAFHYSEQRRQAGLSGALDPRMAEIIAALHATAPDAQIVYDVLGNFGEIPELLPQTLAWMLEQDVQIIVNTIVSPAFEFDESVLSAYETAIGDATTRDILWINNAGNFGASVYRSQFTEGIRSRDWHSFVPEAGAVDRLLTVQAVNSDVVVRAILVADARLGALTLAQFTQDDNEGYVITREAQQEESEPYISLNMGTHPVGTELLLGLRRSSPDFSDDFSLYVYNAVISSNVGLSNDSIPRPNDDPRTLTVGALPLPASNALGLLQTSRDTDRDKPDVNTLGIISDSSSVYSSSVSAAITAGVAAVYAGRDSGLVGAALRARLTANLGDNQALSVPPVNTPINWLVVAVIVLALVLVTLLGYVVLRVQRKETPGPSPKLTSPLTRLVNPVVDQGVIDHPSVLYISANPNDTVPLDIVREYEIIRDELNRGELHERWRLDSEMVTKVDEISLKLLRYHPTVLHFSGHATDDGRLVLHDEKDQNGVSLPVQDVADLIGIINREKKHIRCVVLNACWSLALAHALVRHVDCAVGMQAPMGDISARRFARGFYRGLANGKCVEDSFQLGKNELGLNESEFKYVPCIEQAKGVDLTKLFLHKA